MKWWPWRGATRRRVSEPVEGAPRPTGQWRSLPPLPATVPADAPLTVPAVPPSVLDRLTLPEPARSRRGAPVGRVLGIVTAVPGSGPPVRHAALPVHRRAEHRFTADEDARPRTLPARSGEVPEDPVTVAAPRWTAPPTAPATPWTPSEFLHRAYGEQDRLLARDYLETNGEAQPSPVTHTPVEPAYTAPVPPPVPEPPAPRPRRASLAQARRQGLTLGQTPSAAPEPSAPADEPVEAGSSDEPGLVVGSEERAGSRWGGDSGSREEPRAAAGSPEPGPVVGSEERAGLRRGADSGSPEEPRAAGDEEIGHETRSAWREAVDEAPRPAGLEVLERGEVRDARHDVTSGTSRVTLPDAPGGGRRAVAGEVVRGMPHVDRREVARGVGVEVSSAVVDVASVSGVRDVVGGEGASGVVVVPGGREVVAAAGVEVSPGVVGAAPVLGVRDVVGDEGASGFVDVAPVPVGGDVVGAAGVEALLGVVDVVPVSGDREVVGADVAGVVGAASMSGVRDVVGSEGALGFVDVAPVPTGGDMVGAAGVEVSPGVVDVASVPGVRDVVGSEGAPGVVAVPGGREVVAAAGVEASPGVVDVVPVSDVRVVGVGVDVAGVVSAAPVSGVRDVGDEAAPRFVDVAPVPTGGDVADEVSRGVGGVAPLGKRDVVRGASRAALNRVPLSAEREARREVSRAVRPDDLGGAEPRATPGVVDVTPLPVDRRGVRSPGRRALDEDVDVTPRSVGRQATQSVPDTRGEAAQGASREVVDEAATSVTREFPQEMEMPSPPEGDDTSWSVGRETPRQETSHATPWATHRDVRRPEPARTPPDLVAPTVSWPVPSSRAQFATGDGSPAGESGSDGREADLRAPLSVVGPVALAVGVDVWDVPVRRGPDVTTLSHRLGVRGYTDDNVVYLPDDVGPLDGAAAAPLLAHELTHAAQQRRLGSALPAPGSLAAARLEQDAENVERWVAGGATGAPPPLAHPLDAAAPAPASGGVRQYRMADVSASPLEQPRLDVRTMVADGVTSGRGDVAGADSMPPLDVSSLFGPQPPEPEPGTGTDGPGDGTASGRPSGEFDEETIATLAEAIADIYAVDPPRRWFDLDDVDDFEELAGRIHHELMSRLRLDMVVDRERSGTLLDFG